MRLRSAYLNRQAARNANSVFEAEHEIKKLYRDGEPLWELVRREEKDDAELQEAEKDAEINDIAREEREEIKDIEDLANQTFKVLQEGVILIHTQLDKLRKLMKEDDILEHSGFPIEVADQLEEMLKQEMVSIVSHMRKLSEELDNSKTPDTDNSNE